MQSKQLSQALVIALIASAGFTLGTAHALSPTPNPSVQPSYPNWDSATIYTGGQRVTYNGATYEARWWTQSNNPAEAGEWGPWKLVSGVQITPTPSPSPTPASNFITINTSQVPNGVRPCGTNPYGTWVSNKNYATGEVVAVSSSTIPHLVFTAQAAHLSSNANQPKDNGNGTITYDRTLWSPSNALPAPCPPPTPTPSVPPVNQAPTISFDTSAVVSCTAPFWLKANASDSDGSVSKVEFYIDNSLVGSKDSAPYELIVRNSGGGLCTGVGSKKAMYAIATDNLGLQTRSATITVSIISDVLPTPSPTPVVSFAAWDAKVAYTTGQRVSYNGRAFEAKWWTQGQVPNAADQWGPWKDLGLIASTSPTPTPVITASPSPTPSTTPGSGYISSAEVTTWKNGAKGAYSLVHDDYCSMPVASDPYIKIMDPELKKRGLVAGFGMITGNCSEQHWAAAKQMIANGHEIVSHSRSHPNPYIGDAELETQLNGAAADIAAKLDGYQARYFVWPGDAASSAAIDFLKTKTSYLGGRATHLVANGNVDYTTMPAGVNAANFDNPYRIKWDLFTVDGKWSLYPMGSEILNLHIDAAINQGVWTTRTAHGVDTGYWETIPLNRYLAHLDYAKAKVDSGELWMDTPSNVIKYRYAREHCKLITPTVVPFGGISFDTSSAECKKYATPLTLQLKNSLTVGGIGAMQNGQHLPVRKGENNTYFVTVDPLAGPVILANYVP